MSAEHLSNQFWGLGGYMFHISPKENRESILEKGLVPRTSSEHPEGMLPETGKQRFGNPADTGSYVSQEPASISKDYDIYAVDTSYLPGLVDDKLALDRVLNSYFIPGSIGPERVHLITGPERDMVENAKVQYRWKNPFEGKADGN